jgi:hypothetical protein
MTIEKAIEHFYYLVDNFMSDDEWLNYLESINIKFFTTFDMLYAFNIPNHLNQGMPCRSVDGYLAATILRKMMKKYVRISTVNIDGDDVVVYDVVKKLIKHGIMKEMPDMGK